jgi:DNA (cytosine-5)-methyltransferase 1
MVAIIDLFAGAGGFSVAARLAGGDVRLSVELDAVCCRTLEANDFGKSHRVLKEDVRSLRGDDLRKVAKLKAKEPLIVVGGPPCQPFSKGGYWTDPGHDSRFRRARSQGLEATRPAPVTTARADDRRDLLDEFRRLVTESKADGFVMENVTSLLHPRNLPLFEAVVASFRDAGYSCTAVKAEATSFGVPQKRERVFILGSRNLTPLAPLPMFQSSKGKDAGLLLPPALPVGPFLERFSGPAFFEEGELVTGRWADSLKEIPPGWNYKHLTEWAGHPKPLFEAETRFWNFLLKLDPNSPSWTINANPGPWVGPFHWESRRLRIPELAAIQTFPLGYRFTGNRREQVRQIGNAVPSLLAKAMIEQVIKAIQ